MNRNVERRPGVSYRLGRLNRCGDCGGDSVRQVAVALEEGVVVERYRLESRLSSERLAAAEGEAVESCLALGSPRIRRRTLTEMWSGCEVLLVGVRRSGQEMVDHRMSWKVPEEAIQR